MGLSFKVFVCGTYMDLSSERGAVLDALQRLQLVHRSMEFFGARPERPIETCLSEVRQSDILVAIVGDHYGSLVPNLEVSYSEAEYEEGYRLGLPCLVYLREPPESISVELTESDPIKAQLLEKWKHTLTERHTCRLFSRDENLALQVAVDLARLLREMEDSGKGRVRSSEQRMREPEVKVAPLPYLKVRTAQRFGDEARQLLHDLKVDRTKNIVVVGDFWGNLDFGNGNLASRAHDIFVAKFDSQGRCLWSKRFGEGPEQVCVAVGTDLDNSIILVSALFGRIDLGGGPLSSSSGGRYNVVLAKMDKDGNHAWSRCFGDNNYHVPECMAVTRTGCISIAGRFQGAIDFGSGPVQARSSQTDIFLATFSNQGELLWAKRFGGPYEQQTRSIATDENGNIALTGVFKGAIQLDGLTLAEPKPEDYCGFLGKVDPQGNVLWCKRFGEPQVEQGSVVAFDPKSGDLIAAGFIRNQLPSQVSNDRSVVCFLARYDPSGVLMWSKAFGTNAFPASLSISQTGKILLTGYFDGTVDFGLGPLASAGGYDIFAVIFNANGHPEWSQRFGDRRHQFLVKGEFGADSVVLAGSFHGTIDFGSGALVASGYDGLSEGTEDIFLAIMDANVEGVA